MRMRIACALLALTAACKGKSEERSEATPTPAPAPKSDDPGPVTGGVPTGGPTPTENPRKVAPPPRDERPGNSTDIGRVPAPATDQAPAMPTPAKPDDGLRPAAPSTEANAKPSWPEGAGARPLPRAVVTVTRVAKVDGAANEDVGAKVKGAYGAALETCYRELLVRDGSAKGTATLTFDVGADGAVGSPTAKGFAPAMESCLVATATRWRFRAAGRARYAVELAFRPG